MGKKIFLCGLFFAFCLIPNVVFAYTREDVEVNVDVCQSGCQFDNLDDAFRYLSDESPFTCSYGGSSVVQFLVGRIEIKDTADYEVRFVNSWGRWCNDFLTAYSDYPIEDFSLIGMGNTITIKNKDLLGYGLPKVGGVFHYENVKIVSESGVIDIEGGNTYRNLERDQIGTSVFKNCDLSDMTLELTGNQNVKIMDSKVGNVVAKSSLINRRFSSTSSDDQVPINTYVTLDNSNEYSGNKIERVSEDPTGNDKTYLKTECIQEGSCSSIIVHKADHKSLSLDLKDGIAIDEFLDEKIDDNVSVSIADQSILKYESGKLIPLKRGETTVSIDHYDDHYQFRVTVNKGNPKTSSVVTTVKAPDTALQKGKKLLAIGIMFLIIGLAMQIIIFRKVMKKE